MHSGSPINADAALWRNIADMPQNPATILDLMSIDVANVLAFEKSEAMVGPIPNLIRMAKAADKRLATWPTLVPPEWLPKNLSRKAVPLSVANAGLYGDSCDIYLDVLVCCTWNDWRTARLKLLTLIAKYEPDESIFSSIQELADAICATFPFLLGDRRTPAPLFAANITYPSLEGKSVPKAHHQTAAGFGGWYMLTPLRQVISVGEYLRDGQLAWIRSQGQRLANIYDVSVQG